jgi:hypothetical protein
MIPGSNGCPVAEYTTKAMTEAKAGVLMATALMPARIRRSDRTYLVTAARQNGI